MALARNKTKIICTIGPASRSPETLAQLMQAGMNIARLNFSHGDFAGHKKDIEQIRRVANSLGKTIAIMADLPGPKIRIGDLADEEIILKTGSRLILTTEKVIGTPEKISVSLPELPSAVKPGKHISLNDGFIQLEVVETAEREVECRVLVGGRLRARKGLNLPDADLGISAVTAEDLKIAEFALALGVDALSQSFIEKHTDITKLRTFANARKYTPFIIAKIERSAAVDNLDSILKEADGIMVARGDLGVEIALARIPVVQKMIVHMANRQGKPVITATHMLESMIYNRLPTRAEATDVANAILDGSDCVMLSGESAIGKYPVESVRTLAEIAAEAEGMRTQYGYNSGKLEEDQAKSMQEIIASSVESASHRVTAAAVVVPTRSGITARNTTRYRLPIWILGVSSKKQTCRELVFSYGIIPIYEPDHPTYWRRWIRQHLEELGIAGKLAILTEGPSAKYPERNDRMEIIDLTRN